jgi:transposase-like protein
MSQAAKAREQDRKARARLRVLRHHEQVTQNVSQTCRFFGISRSLFYIWRDRYRQDGLVGLRDVLEGRATTPSRRQPTSSP